MKIILQKLVLENFKGLSGTFEFNPGRNCFFGANGTGKTTLFDAANWCLFGKDSLDSAKFEIKTIVEGEPMHQAEHGVEGTWLIDGAELRLEKVFSETWTKPRGSLSKEFSGHSTAYRVDGNAKTTKRQYDDKVKDVFGSDKFKIVSDPRHFATLPWQKRREILISIVGESDKEEIIAGIEGLRELLAGKSVDEARKLADQRKAKINEEMKTLPARIDEHQKQISGTAGEQISADRAKIQVAASKEGVEKAVQAIDDFNAGTGNAEKLKALNDQLTDASDDLATLKRQARIEINDNVARLESVEQNLKTLNENLVDHTDERQRLLTVYKSIKAETEENISTVCHSCGQDLPEEKIADMKENFNSAKAKKLEENVSRGKEIKAEIGVISGNIAEAEKQKERLGAIKPDPILAVDATPEMKELQKQIDELKVQDFKPVPDELLSDLLVARANLQTAQETEAGVKATENSAARIAELQLNMKNLSAENDRVEKFLFLHDQYNKRLAEETEGPVNEMFDYVNFRMFTTQINGGVVPTCDILNDENKPFETALSHGEQIRAGLDIIKTLSAKFDIMAPVFIDNAESLTVPVELDCQTIELRASTEHQTLTKES